MSIEKTRQDIARAARELFAVYGFKKVSMDEIAAKANISKKTIYNHFDSKGSLIEYLLEQEIRKIGQEVDKIDQKTIPVAKKIHEIMMIIIKYRRNSKLLKTFNDEGTGAKSDIIAELVKKFDQSLQKSIEKRLQAAIDAKKIHPCDTDIVAFAICRIYLALMLEWDKKVDEQKVIANLEQLLTQGLIRKESKNEF